MHTWDVALAKPRNRLFRRAAKWNWKFNESDTTATVGTKLFSPVVQRHQSPMEAQARSFVRTGAAEQREAAGERKGAAAPLRRPWGLVRDVLLLAAVAAPLGRGGHHLGGTPASARACAPGNSHFVTGHACTPPQAAGVGRLGPGAQ